ncbi:unnamed protein product [Soboliphyme baturini]|uniref:NCD2 domain-containing protein n=1 Tax=Soboliphyme baturini TaxID=241478 RepID=A0A183ILL7_9BILA|nr:unnamed protein product [Soboliphyme baturini]
MPLVNYESFKVSVNEAAAQICLHRPALLTRRDELFPLARQVVRDAGYNCLKGHSAIRTESENELSSSETQRKRRTPIGSTGSSGIGSPASTASNNSQASPLGLQDSAQNEQHNLSPLMSDRSHEAKKRRRLDDIGSELNRIAQEQESYKLQVDQAQDLSDLHNIQRELQRLTQRQLELTDEQADLIASGVNDEITPKLEYPSAPCSVPQTGNSSSLERSSEIPAINPNSDCTEDTKVGIACYSNQ